MDFAQKKLASMPTGGKTPLAKGLLKAEDVLDMLYRQDANQDPVVILITDGRATSPLNKGTNPVTDAMEEAKRIGRRHIPVAVIDTESGFIKLGLAKSWPKPWEPPTSRWIKFQKTSSSISGEPRPTGKGFPVLRYREFGFYACLFVWRRQSPFLNSISSIQIKSALPAASLP